MHLINRQEFPADPARVHAMVTDEDFLAHAAKAIPVQRVGQPEDIAATISFLCSEEAGFVSGQVIYVAGGPLD